VCGITGFYHFERRRPAEPEKLQRMCDAITHRGPDSDGMLCRDGIAIGIRRLKIIDLEGGEQPIYNEDGSVAVTFNGEIYNHEELRKDLQAKGHSFKTRSDTEALVHLYEEYGVDMLSLLNGMFAFAIADFRSGRLLLARDRLGIKPLFIARTADTLYWGSEIKCILQNAEIQRAVDQDGLPDYLNLNYLPPGKTLFKGIDQLLPGEYALLNGAGIERESWWDLDFTPDPTLDEHAAIDGALELLEDSVRMRLMSDVPFGAFLSGGIDSSAVVAFMAKHLDTPVKTFSIGFAEASFNELPYARQVARRYGTEHHELVVEPQVEELLPRIVWHSEEPTADSSAIPVFYVSELARRHVTMSLSGDGGDELFAGYETYNAHWARERYRKIPPFLRNALIRPLVDAMPVSNSKVSFDFKARRFVRGAELDADAAHFYWRHVFSEEAKRELLTHSPNGSTTFDRYRHYFDDSKSQDPLSRMLYVDTRFYLPSDMLIKVDRMSMANSLEARVPFLDHRLVEFAARIPSEVKFKGRVRKHLLKKGLEPLLGREILHRKKAGFNVPKNVWLRGPLRAMAHDLLSADRLARHGLFQAQVVQRLLREHDDRRADHSFQLWSLLVFQLWYDQFIDAVPSTAYAPRQLSL
jgi:asparagine synthase (glutamine-hydrolysing)